MVQCGLGRSGRVWAHTTLNIKSNAMLVGLRNDINMWALIPNRILADHNLFLEPHRNFMSTLECVDPLMKAVGGCWGMSNIIRVMPSVELKKLQVHQAVTILENFMIFSL